MIVALFFVLPFFGALLLFYILKVAFTAFNIVVALVFSLLFGTHMIVIALIALALLLLKEKLFSDGKEG